VFPLHFPNVFKPPFCVSLFLIHFFWLHPSLGHKLKVKVTTFMIENKMNDILKFRIFFEKIIMLRPFFKTKL